MSSITTQLRYVIEQLLDDKSLENIEDNWNSIYNEIGLGDYPIFDETHRNDLNKKIIRHYYLQEIGSETVAQFKHRLRDSMFLIMPRYNWYFEQLDALFNLDNKGFITVDNSWEEKYIDTRNENGKTTENNTSGVNSSSENHSSNVSRDENVFEDTPMSMVNNPGGASIENLDYATNVTYDNSNSNDDSSTETSTSTTSFNNKDNTLNSILNGNKVHIDTGFTKSAYEQMKDRYDAYRNIDLEIVTDPFIKRCFLGVWL